MAMYRFWVFLPVNEISEFIVCVFRFNNGYSFYANFDVDVECIFFLGI